MNDLLHLELGDGARLDVSAKLVANALIERLAAMGHPECPARRQIGYRAPGLGGTFVGDILGDDGVTYGLVAADADLGPIIWSKSEQKVEGSTWDGLTNTNTLLRLGGDFPAAKAANAHQDDGHCDFYMPSRREMLIAAANCPGLFPKKRYWTSTPYDSTFAWAVDFENGYVTNLTRHNEFRVRPVRRFPL